MAKTDVTLLVERMRERWRTGRLVAVLLCIIGCFWIVMYYMSQMAGTSTSVNLEMRGFLDSMGWLGPVVGVGGGGWAFAERGLRKRNTERLTARIDELEKLVDPNKATSGLNKSGGTQKGDK